MALALFLGGNAAQQKQGTAQHSMSLPTSSVNWSVAARDDVIAAYAIFRDHHPGMFDPNNRGFPEQLRRSRDTALAFAAHIHDAEGHARALALFSAGLADAHARVQASYSGHGDMLWPGFRTVWRGNALHVREPIQNGPPPDSVLLGCDGRKAADVVRNAFWFYGRPAEAGQWWEFAPSTFLRVRSPYETLPRQCRFRRPDGKASIYSLSWEPVPHDLMEAWFDEGSRREPVGLTEPRQGVFLITLSTFVPDEKGRQQYDRLFRDIDEKIGQMATGKAIVIDLRHNHGGSSSWGDGVADRLWGEAAVEARLAEYFRKTKIWWFADAADIAHWRELATQLRAQGRPEVNDGIDLTELASKLQLALKLGRHFYVEDYGAMLARGAIEAEPRKLPPVYVIMDGGCVSACLDSLDVFTQFPGVKLVGAPTSADSNYIDIRFEPLPSGRGLVILPTKIWVGRPRRAGEVYRPDIPVNDLDWTTATILDHIERDLSG
jgi:hypothetical protein